MSAPLNPSSCCSTTEIINVPGTEGATGAAGAHGTDGVSSFSILVTSSFVVPAVSANTASLAFADTTWMVVGQNVFLEGAGTFSVVSKADGTHAILTYLNTYNNTHSSDTISAGAQISAGGADGINSFSTLVTGSFVVPAISANTDSLEFSSTLWMSVGQNVFIVGAGVFSVVSKADSTHALFTYMDYSVNTHAGATITAGAQISPAGSQPDLSASLPTAITDNSTGTGSNTIAAGAGVQTLSFYIDAATIANGDLLTNYVPGYRFKILSFDARCSKPVTTGAKASTLNLEIGTTDLTGGVISLSGAYILGAAQAGSAITAGNVGTSTNSFSIEAASTTAFIEGAFWLVISIQNMDTADAVKSLSTHVNDLITALT